MSSPDVVKGCNAPSSPRLRFTVALAVTCLFLIGATVNTYRLYRNDPAIVEQELKSSKAEANVFRVLIYGESGLYGGGTGYLLRGDEFGVVIVTNKHICDMPPEDGVFVLDQAGKTYSSKIRRAATLTDLCILEPPSELLTKYKGLSLAPPGTEIKSGETLYVYGHPGLRKLTSSSGPFINETWVGVDESENLQADRLKIGRVDLVIYPGSSGSPVLNEAGQVVGTIFAYERANNIALFIPLSAETEFVNGGM